MKQEYKALDIEAYKKKELLCYVFWDDAGRLVFAIEDASIIVARRVDAHAFNKFPLFAYIVFDYITIETYANKSHAIDR
jgi:hypothetical protein